MIAQINFSELYKKLSAEKLLHIIDNPNEYESAAVDAASIELASREQEQISEARILVEHKRQATDKQTQQVETFKTHIKNAAFSLIKVYGPAASAPQNTVQIITGISLLLALLFVYDLVKAFIPLLNLLTGFFRWDLTLIMYIVMLLLKPMAALLFWFRKSVGWSISAIYLTAATVFYITAFFLSFSGPATEIPGVDLIPNTNSPFVYAASAYLYGRPVWVLCRKNITEAYKVDMTTMIAMLLIGAGLMLPMLSNLLFS